MLQNRIVKRHIHNGALPTLSISANANMVAVESLAQLDIHAAKTLFFLRSDAFARKIYLCANLLL